MYSDLRRGFCPLRKPHHILCVHWMTNIYYRAMWWNSEQRLSLFTLRFSLELLLYGMWCIAGLPQQFLKHQKMLFRNPRPVLGHRIKHIACSLWLSVAKWFSQHFLCHCGCALIGCEWCHYTVYFSFSSEGKDQSVTCVSTLCQVVGKTMRGSWAILQSLSMSLWCGISVKHTSVMHSLLFTTFGSFCLPWVLPL